MHSLSPMLCLCACAAPAHAWAPFDVISSLFGTPALQSPPATSYTRPYPLDDVLHEQCRLAGLGGCQPEGGCELRLGRCEPKIGHYWPVGDAVEFPSLVRRLLPPIAPPYHMMTEKGILEGRPNFWYTTYRLLVRVCTHTHAPRPEEHAPLFSFAPARCLTSHRHALPPHACSVCSCARTSLRTSLPRRCPAYTERAAWRTTCVCQARCSSSCTSMPPVPRQMRSTASFLLARHALVCVSDVNRDWHSAGQCSHATLQQRQRIPRTARTGLSHLTSIPRPLMRGAAGRNGSRLR